MHDPATSADDRYRIAFEASATGIALVMPDGRWLQVNPAFCDLLGREQAALQGLDVAAVLHPDDADAVAGLLRAVAAGAAGTVGLEARFVHAGGTPVVCQLDAARVAGPGDATRFVLLQVQDVGPRKQAEKMQTALHAISEAAHSATDLGDLFGRIHAIVGELIPARNFFVSLYDAARGEVSFPYFVDECDPPPAPKPLEESTLTAEILRTGRPLLITAENRDQHGDLVNIIVGSESIDWLGVPLIASGKAIGTLTVQSYTGDVRYSETDQRLLQFVSAQVAAAIERKRSEERLQQMAQFDELTGLPNRALFEDRLHMALAKAQRDDDRLALLYLDLDNFKPVNDTYGHAVGDLLLREVGKRLCACVRRSDTVGRIGGDEFVILLNSIGQATDAERIAEKMRAALAEPYALADHTVFVSSSIGIAVYPEHGTTQRELALNADAAMYRAKNAGRNRIHAWSAHDGERPPGHGDVGWMRRIEEAFAHDRFVLHRQSKRELAGDDGLDHFEVLLRMRDADGAFIPPMAFIPYAERHGLMPRIDRWVIATALARLGTLARPSVCCINLSGASLTDPTLADYIRTQVEAHGVVPSSVCFEITETAAIADLGHARVLMDEVRGLGCLFALDDFGSGMSSFAYLKHLPVDFLKIDGDFIQDLATSPIDAAMVTAINDVAHVMGLRTIAERVEDDATIEALRRIGVDYVQGYGIDRPVPWA
jgi:diguanylate cyclase (GGDEF)-like protein/PAS domain S-box-containing protein